MNRAHKFGYNHKINIPNRPPIGVLWITHQKLKFPHVREHDFKWSIKTQEEIKIIPNETKSIQLKFGIKIALGVVLVSLVNELKALKCTLSNESVVQDCDDIFIAIHNNSNKEIIIKEDKILCYLTYINL